jgi:hypothetical protein
MSYDRFGRTPEMARRQRVYEWLCILALGVIVACVMAAAALVVALLS